jgi:hypothetical protein
VTVTVTVKEPAVDAAEQLTDSVGVALPARVWVGEPGLLTDDDQQLVLSALAACGATAGSVEVISATRSDTATTLAWVVLAAVPLQGFLSVLGEKLADDAHGRLLAAVKLVAERYKALRRGRPGQTEAEESGDTAAVDPLDPPSDTHSLVAPASPAPLILMDRSSRLKIVIEADLPVEAVRSLVALDLSQFTIGPLHYDRAANRWRSELDEAAGR